MAIIEIESLGHPGVEVFGALTETQLRNRMEGERGLFVAESPKVIRTALECGYEPTALLCERKHIVGDAADIVAACSDIPVFTGERALLAELTGYTLTRGVLCAMRRKRCGTLAEVCGAARRVAVIDGVTDATNTGAIFRSAAALGMDAVVVTRGSCDPLNRRAVRVSMGAVLRIPWTWADDAVGELAAIGFKTAAMALREDSVEIDDERLNAEPKIAVMVGTEGDGLPRETIGRADYVVRIPMCYGVDSLNVGAAATIAFWQLGRKAPRVQSSNLEFKVQSLKFKEQETKDKRQTH